jgi:hypothetical protein
MLVLPDADLDLVADSAINAGFGSAGERCMAISVVVAVEPVADDLIAKIASRMAQIKVGDGRRSCDMGPLVTKVHRDKVASYIEIAEQDGAEIVVDGRGVVADGAPNGFWLGPTLIDKVPLLERKREIVARQADNRHRVLSGTRSGPGQAVVNLPPPADKTRDTLAAEIGVSGKTYDALRTGRRGHRSRGVALERGTAGRVGCQTIKTGCPKGIQIRRVLDAFRRTMEKTVPFALFFVNP